MGKKEKEKSAKAGHSSETESQTDQGAIAHADQKKYSKRKLETNWSKYEEHEDDSNAPGLRGLDFAQFANNDRKESGGSHFQFAQEKEWADLTEKVSDYLKLDLGELSHEIMCVPLHERLRLDANLFSKKQIEGFERDAQLNREKIRQDVIKILPKQVLMPSNPNELQTPTPYADELDSFIDNLDIPQPTLQSQNIWDNGSNLMNLNSVSEELDLILAMPSTSASVEDTGIQARAEVKLELSEDWLDSLLND